MKKKLICLAIVLFFSLIFLNILFISGENTIAPASTETGSGSSLTASSTASESSTTEESSTGETSSITETSSENSTASETSETQTSLESVSDLEKLENEFEEKELEINPGITPDSNFYFIEDQVLSRFRDDLRNREQKIGEIREMIKKGDIDSARIALERYRRYAENLEKEVDPAKREEARRSAAAIYNTLKEIENEIPEENKEEFVDDIIDKEKRILTAAEIADKIKVLCKQLAGLDPLEYSRVCMIKENIPKWQKKLNKELTKEQEKEAKEFGEIMSECFKTSGRECRCNDISFYDFSVACNKVAPLAVACDKGDENACEEMESIEMPELPFHLQDIFDDIETKYNGDKIELHMPKECIRAGARDKKSCMMVMFKLNAPDECIEALEKGKINPDNEKEAREMCNKIMFEANAPDECIEAGITNPKECGRYMFKINAPDECIEAGLTGESRSDEKKCKEIMKEKREEFGDERKEGFKGELRKGGRGPPGSGCMKIQNPSDRLICFEEAVGKMGEEYGVGEEFKEVQGEITSECREHRIHWPPDCERFMREELPQLKKQKQIEREQQNERYREREREIFQPGEMKCPDGICDDFEKNNPYACPEDCGGQRERREDEIREEGCGDCSSKCPGASRTDCINNRCECFYEERQPPQEPAVPTPSPEPSPEPTPTPTPEPTPIPSPEPTPSPEPAPVTGGIIFDNKFLDYWFKK